MSTKSSSAFSAEHVHGLSLVNLKKGSIYASPSHDTVDQK